MENRSGTIKNIVWAVIAFVVIICIAVSLTVMCRQIYYFDIEYLNIPEKSGIAADICRKNYDILIDYNMLFSSNRLELPDFTLSDTEQIHFEEVRHLFISMQVIAVAGALILGYKIIRQYRGLDGDFRWLKYVLLLGTGIAAAAGLLVAVNWELAFLLMHKLFFRNDYWILPVYKGGIITILPEEFFMHCGIVIMVLTAAMAVASYFLWLKLEKCKETQLITEGKDSIVI